MNSTQKTIKYLAIAFAAFLAFTIIAAIGSAISAVIEAVTNIEKSEDTINYNQSYEDVESITIEGYIYNISIVEGDTLSVDLENVSDKYTSTIKNGTLKLEYNGHGLGWLSWLNGTSKSNKAGKVVLTIPSDFVADKFTIDAGVGSIEFDTINTDFLKINAGTGSISGKNLIAQKADIDCGIGSIDITNISLNHTSIDSGTGNVNLTGRLTGKNKINGGIGNINLTLLGTTDDYNIDVDGGIGDVTINGKKYSDVKWNNITASNSLEIDAGIGNINIVFE